MNDWTRRWQMIRLTTVISSSMGFGLFFLSPELAKEIASSVALIVASLIGLVSVYIGGAVWDDKK